MIDREKLRTQFLELISDYSEASHASGWYYIIDTVIRKEGGLWLAMAVACGGWPKGYRAEDGWDPLTPEERDTWALMTGTDDLVTIAREMAAIKDELS